MDARYIEIFVNYILFEDVARQGTENEYKTRGGYIMFEAGTTWLKVDFHLHTESDREFKYDGERFYDEYIEKLESEDVRIGVITNHNKFNYQEFKELKKRARKKDIFLIPGVELTVKEGQNGIHTLIAFNDEEWLLNGNDDINNFLNQVFTGIENRESENTRCKEDIMHTIDKLNEFNKDYFIIFAHIEQRSGLIKECGGGLIESLSKYPEFKKNVYGFQKLRTRDNVQKLKDWMGYELAFIEGSDPKCINEIGKDKLSYIKIGTFSFDAVKLSLRDFEFRISAKLSDINHAFIKSIQLTGGKLDGNTIYLSNELNTLIGIRGSGKSSILEIIRYGLDLGIGADIKYKVGLVENTLASGGVLTINLVDKHHREYKIQRILNESPSILDDQGNDVNVSINTIINNPLYFGQKDLSQTESGYEFNLLNKLLGDSLSDVVEEISSKESELINSINKCKIIQDIDSKIKDLTDKNSDLDHKMKIFQEKGVAEKLKKQTTFSTDKVQVEKVQLYLSNIHKLLTDKVNKNIIKEIDELKNHQSEYNQDIFNLLDARIDEFKAYMISLENQFVDINLITDEITKLKETLISNTDNLREEFAEIKRQIDVPNLKADDYVQYSTLIKSNTNQVEEFIKKKAEKTALEANIKSNIRERNELLLKEFNIYKTEIERINTSQNELVININFKGNKDVFKSSLKNKFKGSGISDNKYQKICEIFTDFVMIFDDVFRNKGDELKKIITEGEYEKVKENFDQRLAELITEKVPNRIDIDYHGKPLHKLSLGQRASALVLFILTQEDNDLIIIDQPEDDLDNQVIYRELISTIKSKKTNIQFIFATHNANIPVLGDAEQIIASTYDDDKISIASGSIDVPDMQTKIVDIMEGGPKAFERRNNIYKLWRVDR